MGARKGSNMVSTVLRPNHYELLGLTPEASGDEIVQAFAKELGLLRPRAFGTLAEVTVAYETLKDPIKRRAYDDAIGLTAETQSPPPDVPSEWKPFLVRASAKSVERPAIPLPAASVRPAPKIRPEPSVEPKITPSATALLRDSSPAPTKEQEALSRPEISGNHSVEPLTDDDPPYYSGDLISYDSDERSIDLKRAAMAIGWPILAIATFGAVAGWSAGIMDHPPQEEPLTIPLPPATASESVTAAPSAPAAPITEISPEPQARTPRTTTEAAQVRPPLQIDLPEEKPSETAQSEESPLVKIAAEPVVANSTASSSMPLPKAVIASTIRRIGYPCSEVASTDAVEGGAPGTFTVTCTSGHSYRAAPVDGRYRFRKLATR